MVSSSIRGVNKQLKQFITFSMIILAVVLLACYSQLSIDSSIDSIKQLVTDVLPMVIGVVWCGYIIVKNESTDDKNTIINRIT